MMIPIRHRKKHSGLVWHGVNLSWGSRNEGNVVNAKFNDNGNLNVNSNLNPQNHNGNLGGRFVVVSFPSAKHTAYFLKICLKLDVFFIVQCLIVFG